MLNVFNIVLTRPSFQLTLVQKFWTSSRYTERTLKRLTLKLQRSSTKHRLLHTCKRMECKITWNMWGSLTDTFAVYNVAVHNLSLLKVLKGEGLVWHILKNVAWIYTIDCFSSWPFKTAITLFQSIFILK